MERRKKGCGDHRIFPTSSSDYECRSGFYEQPSSKMNAIPSRDSTVILIDANATIRQSQLGMSYTPSQRLSDNTDMLVEYLGRMDHSSAATRFRQLAVNLCTFRGPRNRNAMLGHILVKRQFQSWVRACRVNPINTMTSDHLPVVAKVDQSWKCRKTKCPPPRKSLSCP